jgi:hypothetical protein
MGADAPATPGRVGVALLTSLFVMTLPSESCVRSAAAAAKPDWTSAGDLCHQLTVLAGHYAVDGLSRDSLIVSSRTHRVVAGRARR